MNKYQQKHIIKLSDQQRFVLNDIVRKGKNNVRIIKRAEILLKSDEGCIDEEIAEDIAISKRTVERIRLKFVEGSLDNALYDAPRSGQPTKLNPKAEAHLIAIACSDPPEGRSRWTLELLQKKLIKDKKVKSISTVAIWEHLTNRGIKPWLEKNVVHSGS